MAWPADTHPPIVGIVAGRGALPCQLVNRLRERRIRTVVATVARQTEAVLPASRTRAFPLGAIGAMARYFAEEGAEQLFLVGALGAPRLRELGPDWGAVAPLIAATTGRGDLILRAVARAFTTRGIAVADPRPFLGDLLATSGLLAGPRLEARWHDTVEEAIRGAALAGVTGSGQAAIAHRGQLVLLETRAGTNALVASAPGPGAVLAKLSASGQDLRFDLPVIGPTTVRLAAAKGLKAIVLEAQTCILVDAPIVIRLCNEAGLCLLGIERPSAAPLEACQAKPSSLHSRP